MSLELTPRKVTKNKTKPRVKMNGEWIDGWRNGFGNIEKIIW
jgi:hypothetical protein